MPERGSLLARMPGSGVPGPVKSNRIVTNNIYKIDKDIAFFFEGMYNVDNQNELLGYCAK